MLTLDQLISEATVLTDTDKAILIDKITDSMTGEIDRDALIQGIQNAQARIAEIVGGAFQDGNRGTVQTIPGDIALVQIRQLLGK